MKKIATTVLALTLAAGLTACSEIGSPAENISDEPNTSQNIMSSQSLTSSQNTISSEEPILSEGTDDSNSSQNTTSFDEPTSSESTSMWASYLADFDLKGEELAAKLEWPYEDPIDLAGALAFKTIQIDDHDVDEEIPLSEISNKFSWSVICDYGYISMVPGNGDTYEYKKYKAGDKIGDFTVTKIRTSFDNVNFAYKKYFDGVRAYFDGEITLVGELLIISPNGEIYGTPGDIIFVPNNDSRKKLPTVDFLPLIDDLPDNELYDWARKDHVTIHLGNIKDYSDIDFGKFPDDGSSLNVKVAITDYHYLAESSLPISFGGFANIVDLEII